MDLLVVRNVAVVILAILLNLGRSQGPVGVAVR